MNGPPYLGVDTIEYLVNWIKDQVSNSDAPDLDKSIDDAIKKILTDYISKNDFELTLKEYATIKYVTKTLVNVLLDYAKKEDLEDYTTEDRVKEIVDDAIALLPSGPIDGTPIGTVISFMGTKAPDGYLVCNGAQYEISDYPDLANTFKDNFGSANYFGGNGTTTFNVPDMRNLFLRGYHGADTQLSGNIGRKQDATSIPVVYHGVSQSGSSSNAGKPYIGISTPNTPGIYHLPENTDQTTTGGISATITLTGETAKTPNRPAAYTARPVNMAVLYCIKAKGGN